MKKFLLLFFLASPSWGAPSISAVSTVTDGQAATITGTSFGTKSTAAPEIWDTMESGSFHASWSDTHNLSVNSTNNKTGSTKNGTLNFTEGIDEGKFETAVATAAKWYVSYWMKVNSDWDWGTTEVTGTNKFLSNIKILRFGIPPAENYVIAYRGWENEICANLEDTVAYDVTCTMTSFRSDVTKDVWHHWQFMFGEGTGLGTTDGFIQVWFDGESQGSRSDIRTKIATAAGKHPYIVGFSNVWGPNDIAGPPDTTGDDNPNNFFIDDVYVDRFWSRVEIGDNAVYNSCTHREMQIITAWSDTEITVTANTSNFPPAAARYLFVVDASGDVSSGFALDGGDSEELSSTTAGCGD